MATFRISFLRPLPERFKKLATQANTDECALNNTLNDESPKGGQPPGSAPQSAGDGFLFLVRDHRLPDDRGGGPYYYRHSLVTHKRMITNYRSNSLLSQYMGDA